VKALSIRQPWAWAIVKGHKTIENRTWATSYRGPLLIHASKSIDPHGMDRLAKHARAVGFKLPLLDELEFGGVVGRCELLDVVEKSRSRWFKGPKGWLLAAATQLSFRPLAGQVRLFDIPIRDGDGTKWFSR
jgi:hypothetical protein